MTESKEVDFTSRAGSPTVIEVVAHDGATYEIRVALVVLGIRDALELQSSPYGLIPKMELQVQLAIDTRPKGATPVQ